MGVYKREDKDKKFRVLDDEGNVIGLLSVVECHYWWKPDEGDGWSKKEMKTKRQHTRSYNVYSQVLGKTEILEDIG